METNMQERHDPFYFSRSDLSDEEKLSILDSKLKQSLEDIKTGKGRPIEEAVNELVSRLTLKMKQAS
jgi:hypothetical protein